VCHEALDLRLEVGIERLRDYNKKGKGERGIELKGRGEREKGKGERRKEGIKDRGRSGAGSQVSVFEPLRLTPFPQL
jgi:hypothetical protein